MRTLFPLFALVLVTCGSSPKADAVPDQTRVTMNRVFDAVAELLPLAVDDKAFDDPAQRAAIAASLESLASRSDLMRAHGAERDQGFQHLARSLAADSAAARDASAQGRTAKARYRVRKLTENCVACHARTPGDAGGEFGLRLFHKMDVGKLGLEELAQLQQATRQYDAALENYEQLLSKQDRSRVWSVAEYLALSVRVRGDLERPKPILAQLLTAENLPGWARREVEAWSKDLTTLAGRTAAPDALDDARALIDAAVARQDFPADRQALPHLLVAARQLDAFLAANPRGERGAEACYLLGRVEARLGTSPRLGQVESLLEAAIRLAPASGVARKALDRLEWHMAVEYSGSGGTTLPEDVRNTLDELRTLVEG